MRRLVAGVGLASALLARSSRGEDTEQARRVAEARRATEEAVAALHISTHEAQESARHRLEEAVTTWRDLGQDAELARALIALAHAAEGSGALERSLQAAREARDLAATLQDRAMEAQAEVSLGHAEWLLGRPAAALDHQRRALALAEAAGDSAGARDARYKIGLALQSLGRRDEATATFEALAAELRVATQEISPRQAALIAFALGTIRRDAGDFLAARAAFAESAAKAEAAGHLSHQARSLAELGEVQSALGERNAARSCLEQAVALWRRHGDDEGTAIALVQLARFERREDELAVAERHLASALVSFDQMREHLSDPGRRASYFGLRQSFYAQLVDLLVERHRRDPAAGHDRRAFHASEQARARALLDLMVMGGAAPLPARSAATVSVAELQDRSLDGESLLLSYFQGIDHTYRFVVTRGSFRLEILEPSRSELVALVERSAELLARSDTRLAEVPADRAGRELGAALLGGLPELPSYRRLLVVPDGELSRVPFAALATPEAELAEPLVARHELTLLPSASTLTALVGRRSAESVPPRSIAVFADPVFGDDDARVPRATARPPANDEPVLSRLPATQRESAAILRLATGWRTQAADGFDATRALALSPAVANTSILHFATHAVVDVERPERTALVLSRRDVAGRKTDGLLRLGDLAPASLRAELVVLSGCSTRQGYLMPGEGLLGLVRGFLDAGAARVVASLWPVRDEATARFFELFYAALLRDGATPSAALRSAQLALQQEPRFAAPHFWAGFVLEGDPR